MIWIIMIAFMIVGGIVSSRLKSKFKKYSQIPTLSAMSGKEIAERMLADNHIYDVKVISVPGKLTDHYNPMDKTINLSPDVYQGRHVSAAAVAAHECGHAVQHATAYSWLQMRSQMVPMVNMSNKAMSTVFLLGIFGVSFLGIFSFQQLIMLFIILQAVVTAFTLITLPVEFDASRRALVWLRSSGITSEKELTYANDALKWAASTYVVAALAAATYLLYYVSMLRD
ncbi:MAG: zinc metallopeptidase [Flavobacteriales bacterium]|jgi:Zn-dependent membrane protease YugP|nr:zinc metallopeptidase [Flavobacteriales bacterium]MDG1348089.1 zinc metallopeptidase [Flavobacteriales bacterium]